MQYKYLTKTKHRLIAYLLLAEQRFKTNRKLEIQGAKGLLQFGTLLYSTFFLSSPEAFY